MQRDDKAVQYSLSYMMVPPALAAAAAAVAVM
jgi:hypothetical protein